MLALPVLAAFGMHDLCRKLVVIFLSSGFDACVIPDTFLQDPSKYFSSTPWSGYPSTNTRGIYDLNPIYERHQSSKLLMDTADSLVLSAVSKIRFEI